VAVRHVRTALKWLALSVGMLGATASLWDALHRRWDAVPPAPGGPQPAVQHVRTYHQ
jgi:hypothetical protein